MAPYSSVFLLPIRWYCITIYLFLRIFCRCTCIIEKLFPLYCLKNPSMFKMINELKSVCILISDNCRHMSVYWSQITTSLCYAMWPWVNNVLFWKTDRYTLLLSWIVSGTTQSWRKHSPLRKTFDHRYWFHAFISTRFFMRVSCVQTWCIYARKYSKKYFDEIPRFFKVQLRIANE